MKVIEELQQKINESMDSVEAIQGEKFKQLLSLLMTASQHMRFMSMLVHKYDKDKMVKKAAEHAAETLSMASTLLAESYEMTEEQMAEMMKWMETFDGHIAQAIKEADHG